MPTNRRRLSRSRRATLLSRDRWLDFHLEFFDLDNPLGFSGDVEAARAYWIRYGDEITADWVADHSASRTMLRPAAWWYWTHRRSRPIANPAPPEQEARWRAECTFDGVLHTTLLHGHGAPDGQLVPWQEPEIDYLDRLNLLTDAEREALGLPRRPRQPQISG